MELKKHHTRTSFLPNTITHYTRKVLRPFFEYREQPEAKFIQPIHFVESQLNDYYVTQKLVSITFEYYTPEHKIKLKTIRAYVHSTVRADRKIILSQQIDKVLFLLNINQILRIDSIN